MYYRIVWYVKWHHLFPTAKFPRVWPSTVLLNFSRFIYHLWTLLFLYHISCPAPPLLLLSIWFMAYLSLFYSPFLSSSFVSVIITHRPCWHASFNIPNLCFIFSYPVPFIFSYHASIKLNFCCLHSTRHLPSSHPSFCRVCAYRSKIWYKNNFLF